MKKRFFTLLELLVIVAIIALLAALLLPSLQRAREMGKRMKCLSSIKQIGICWISYASDSRGYIYPNTAPGYGWKSGAKSFTTFYGIKPEAISCPSGVIKSNYGSSAHYSHNFDRLKNVTPDGLGSYYGMLVKIKNPNRKLAFCDYGTDANINTSYGSAGSAVIYINYIPGCGKWAPAAAKLANPFPGYSVTDVNKKDFYNDFVNGRHLSSVSVLFADGRAVSMPAMDVAPQFYPPGTGTLFNFWYQ